MLTVTFIRHGQSEDNPKGIWAGWKDAPLSELGWRQASALAAHLSTTKIDHVYASPLLRARDTGFAVQQSQPHSPPFTLNVNLREHHFGIAEGQPWTFDYDHTMPLEECFSKGIFPATIRKFPGGESDHDLLERAHVAVKEVVLPHLEDAKEKDVHVALASHGLCIAMLIRALLSYDPTYTGAMHFDGLENTAWTQAEVLVDSSYVPNDNPNLNVRITLRDQGEHLKNLRPEPLKAKTSEEEERKEEALAFFGGGGKASKI